METISKLHRELQEVNSNLSKAHDKNLEQKAFINRLEKEILNQREKNIFEANEIKELNDVLIKEGSNLVSLKKTIIELNDEMETKQSLQASIQSVLTSLTSSLENNSDKEWASVEHLANITEEKRVDMTKQKEKLACAYYTLHNIGEYARILESDEEEQERYLDSVLKNEEIELNALIVNSEKRGEYQEKLEQQRSDIDLIDFAQNNQSRHEVGAEVFSQGPLQPPSQIPNHTTENCVRSSSSHVISRTMTKTVTEVLTIITSVINIY